MSGLGPARVKTRLGEACTELFSQLPSSERSCQYNRLPHRRNRDGSSTRKLENGVFTQPGSKGDLKQRMIDARSSLNSRHFIDATVASRGLADHSTGSRGDCCVRLNYTFGAAPIDAHSSLGADAKFGVSKPRNIRRRQLATPLS